MQRKWQLENTLPHNLDVVRRAGHLVALCNYNSQDGLDEYVAEKFTSDVREGALVYFHTKEPTSFHMSIAKNVAHRLGLRRSPDVLFNLDADNFISESTIDSIQRVFSRSSRSVLHNWTWDGIDGTAGRIALSAADWLQVGGYDETLLPLTVQDIDLLFRARAAGLEYVLDREISRPPVPNNVEQKLENVQIEAAPNVRGDQLFRHPERARLMMAENIGRALNRPITLDAAEQRRFRGMLNFREETVV